MYMNQYTSFGTTSICTIMQTKLATTPVAAASYGYKFMHA